MMRRMSGWLCWRWDKVQVLLLAAGITMGTVLWATMFQVNEDTTSDLAKGFTGRTADSRLSGTHSQTQNEQKDQTSAAVWADLSRRRQRVEEICNRTGVENGNVHGVFVNRENKLAYCFVPKTGCTFWKQVFTFLNNDHGLKEHVKSPFDISRLTVHSTRHTNGERWSQVKELVEAFQRFMFARDPYSRLWSAYIDKFWLPDFWLLFGRKVLMTRKPIPSTEVLTCGMGVTFPEFVNFALKTPEPHWVPVAKFCDPCQFKPQVIGKMETYTRDARAVLGQAGLTWMLDGVDHKEHVGKELDMLVEYNFEVIHKKAPSLGKSCITEEQLGARLWKAFQYNGYILDNSTLPKVLPFTKDNFLKHVKEAFEVSHAKGNYALKEQKKRHMENAFKQLPQSVLLDIQHKFALDFEMFEYTPRNFNS